MEFKFNRTCIIIMVSILTAFLLAVIIVIWVQFSHGNFKVQNLSMYPLETPPRQVKNSENTTYLKKFTKTGSSELETNSIETYTKQAEVYHTTVANYTLFPQDDVAEINVAYVKPLKVNNPVADYRYYENTPLFHEKPPQKRIVHFRHKQADFWDDSPVYEIEAFGKKFYLELRQNNKFISRNLHVTHSWGNYSYRKPHNPKLSGCFYNGRVKGDENSYVAVSLCNGMTGYIRTSEDTYYIQPAQNTSDNDHLHVLRNVNSNMDNSIGTDSHCHLKVENATRNNSTKEKHKLRISPERKKRSPHKSTSLEYRQEDVGRNINWLKNSERRQRRMEYFIKVLVVADVNVLNAHGSDEELEHFILVIMADRK